MRSILRGGKPPGPPARRGTRDSAPRNDFQRPWSHWLRAFFRRETTMATHPDLRHHPCATGSQGRRRSNFPCRTSSSSPAGWTSSAWDIIEGGYHPCRTRRISSYFQEVAKLGVEARPAWPAFGMTPARKRVARAEDDTCMKALLERPPPRPIVTNRRQDVGHARGARSLNTTAGGEPCA